ncbi:ProQ/FINO family protein [Methylobacterium radiotolerans]|uniref:ProQ/FinO domain-containing protein n=1 Tax=Methylobacterium radiotolerans (strain ATCC 27329 / DSM 1819 / JCM 2831 / NBRC 15690 / NCIMB 10815 / 0-1) TaxID=426355 RepID=B1MA06_METRJ|nr:ProQ/FINO family protein [Methylobacterium radiotolerans]ACB28343.1 hypothetical protein Mrad2831_6423 [Methylobacterium radiotolerans JCM 2831]GEN01852.1 hypothetical protein MRA01_63910 [Methylobacterium radiotolerans]
MIDAPITTPAPAIEPKAATVVAGRYEVSRAAELCALLRERPLVFPSAPGDAVRPLVLGILQALTPLARPETTPQQLRQAVRVYCLGLSYLLAQGRPVAWRYDLSGHPVEPVSAEHRGSARTRFKTVRAYRDRILAERRAAQLQPDRPAAAGKDVPADVDRQPA